MIILYYITPFLIILCGYYYDFLQVIFLIIPTITYKYRNFTHYDKEGINTIFLKCLQCLRKKH